MSYNYDVIDGPCAASSVDESKLYIFGGKSSTGSWYSYLRSYDFSSVPQALENSSLDNVPLSDSSCVLNDEYFVLFGGRYNNDNVTCSSPINVNIFSTKNNTWFTPTPVDGQIHPYRRYGASAVLSNNSIFLYGGRCGNTVYSDYIWRYSLSSFSWTPITPDSGNLKPLYYHSVFVRNSVMYLVGGETDTFQQSDIIYSYDMINRAWSSVIQIDKFARSRALTASVGNRAIVYGGFSANTSLSDSWQFIIEKECSSLLNCTACISSPMCGWCDSSKCVSGNHLTAFDTSTCNSFYIKSNCPNDEFPSWAIALIVIGGVVLLGIIIFGIMKSRDSNKDYSPI
eukprot:TRINITY_DN1074_c0_g1_i1.p1 TRINITY_DN1074_c0_g1~~TRINITY_DN1074_c0_g1_i1.p1  ORF type:complete len:371 (+),score=44.00 TRINITY_DN1074_c0_g1_i1:91-1113(+)